MISEAQSTPAMPESNTTDVPKSGSIKTSPNSAPTIARGLKGSPEPAGSRATAQLKTSTATSLANSAG